LVRQADRGPAMLQRLETRARQGVQQGVGPCVPGPELRQAANLRVPPGGRSPHVGQRDVPLVRVAPAAGRRVQSRTRHRRGSKSRGKGQPCPPGFPRSQPRTPDIAGRRAAGAHTTGSTSSCSHSPSAANPSRGPARVDGPCNPPHRSARKAHLPDRWTQMHPNADDSDAAFAGARQVARTRSPMRFPRLGSSPSGPPTAGNDCQRR
jgi:hypothetical protein